MSLLETLKTLNPADDSLWTEDGLPALDAVKAITGDKKLTRQALNEVALGLTRENVAIYESAPAPANAEPEVVTEVTPEPEVDSNEDAYQKAIAFYQQGVQRQREERAARAEAFLQSGFTLEDVLTAFPQLRR